MYEIMDPKDLDDETLTDKIDKCRKHLGYVTARNQIDMMSSIGLTLALLEEEQEYRYHKRMEESNAKMIEKNKRKKLEDRQHVVTYPINLGDIESGEKN